MCLVVGNKFLKNKKLILLFGVAWVAINGLYAQPKPLSFRLQGADGKTITAQSLRGKVVLLEFWASWCPPCLTLFPQLEKVYQHFKSRSDVVVLAVNRMENPELGRAYFQRLGLSMPLAFDPYNVAGSFLIVGMPSGVLLDRKGRVVVVHRGYDQKQEVAAQLIQEIEAVLHKK